MTRDEFYDICIKYFDTHNLNVIRDSQFGLVFLSVCSSQLDDPSLQDMIEVGLEDPTDVYELERQRGLIYGMSETTNPHTSQYDETGGKSPGWVWELL